MKHGNEVIKVILMIIVSALLTEIRHAPNLVISAIGDILTNFFVCLVVGKIFDYLHEGDDD